MKINELSAIEIYELMEDIDDMIHKLKDIKNTIDKEMGVNDEQVEFLKSIDLWY